ncbi:MAG: cyclic nucleotide-binding domain-containing protein [Nitrospinae bacterium]|nr:cyclic nucleotide-binding domain-containing protein [Nitrospinota bacterium]
MSIKDTGSIQRYSEGDVIISEGIVSNNAYVIISGKVRITKKVDKKTVVVGTLKEGEVFGEMGLIVENVRSASVVAAEDVEVGIIDKETFERLLEALPDDLRAIMAALVDRLKMTTNVLTRVGLELDNTRNQLQSYTMK